jgi:hypothetical protein
MRAQNFLTDASYVDLTQSRYLNTVGSPQSMGGGGAPANNVDNQVLLKTANIGIA